MKIIKILVLLISISLIASEKSEKFQINSLIQKARTEINKGICGNGIRELNLALDALKKSNLPQDFKKKKSDAIQRLKQKAMSQCKVR